MKVFNGLLINVTTKVVVLVACLIFSGCVDEDIVPLPSPPVADFTCVDLIHNFSLISSSTGEITEYQWEVFGDNQLRLWSPNGHYSEIDLPSIATTVTVSLTVKNSGGSSTCTKNIDLPPLTFSRKYGLGKNLESERSNNVDYEWYIDQGSTGQYSTKNCCPACVTMAIKWACKSFSKTTEDARNALPMLPSEAWATGFFTIYLTDNNILWEKKWLNEADDLKNQIDNGNIFKMSLDMHYIRYESKPEWRIDSFYRMIRPGSYHAIIVKGYKIVDGILWFEVYDPYSLGQRNNDDGSFKGRDRYFRSEDIMEAAFSGNQFPEIIVIHKIMSIND